MHVQLNFCIQYDMVNLANAPDMYPIRKDYIQHCFKNTEMKITINDQLEKETR